jgi:hypothetical protein
VINVGENFSFESIIDVDLWNRAGWCGTIYGAVVGRPPLLGILFKNKVEGSEIFDNWIDKFGTNDELEEIYLSLVEGEIKGEPKGYSVIIGYNILSSANTQNKDVKKLGRQYFFTGYRVHRMTPPPESRNLAIFKSQYEKYGQYLLIPSYGDEKHPERIETDVSRGIIKRQIYFKNVKDIGENDIEQVIFKK